jgi:hypothetical protein
MKDSPDIGTCGQHFVFPLTTNSNCRTSVIIPWGTDLTDGIWDNRIPLPGAVDPCCPYLYTHDTAFLALYREIMYRIALFELK